MSVLNFEGFAGNEETKSLLSLAFDEGRFPHAIILEGSAESGKAVLADILARAAVCVSDGGEKPCGHCPACLKAKAGSHPDIKVLDGDADPRAFPIDAIRAIRSDAYIRPNEAPNKVYLLAGVQNMTEISQNALLKVFEEPPENVLFLLTTVSASALLPTVRSRAQTFLLEDAPKTDKADLEYTAKLTAAITAKNEADLLFLTAGLIKDKSGLRSVLAQLELIFRDAAVLRAGGDTCLSGQREAAEKLGSELTRDKILLLLEEAKKVGRALDLNANAALLVTAMCAGFRTAAGR
jgi:DNA polymerase III gamma/tau subunit